MIRQKGMLILIKKLLNSKEAAEFERNALNLAQTLLSLVQKDLEFSEFSRFECYVFYEII